MPADAIADTSVFIARENERSVGSLPERLAISVVTLGELQLGVLSATTSIRRRRADTLALAREADPIPITEATMNTWARLVHDCQVTGIHRTVKLTDALVAATAVEHSLPVATQDHDFDQMAMAHPDLEVISV